MSCTWKPFKEVPKFVVENRLSEQKTGVNILGLTLQQKIVVLQSLGSHYADQGSNISSVTYKLGDLGHTDLMSLNLCPNLRSEDNNSSSWRIVVRIK